LEPFSEVFDFSNLVFDSVRVYKLLYNFFHFFNIALSIKRLRSQMSWLELLERNLIVLARLNHFALGYFFGEFRYRREQHWLVRAFEVFELFPVEKGNEIGDGIDLECLSGITSLLGIDGSKDQVLIVICFGSGFECGLDSHARWAGLGPEVDDEARAVFY
jgi:hypothetical protein